MRFLIISIVLIISGCASTPTSLGASNFVPQQRILAGYSQFADPTSESVMITVVRDTGFSGSALSALLSIDAIYVAKMRASERLVLHVEPGNHIFGVVSTPNAGAPIIEQSHDMKPVEDYFFRISTGDGAMRIQRSALIN